MRAIVLAVLLNGVLLICSWSSRADERLSTCDDKASASHVLEDLVAAGMGQVSEAIAETEVLPAGTSAKFILQRPFDAGERMSYRALVKGGSAQNSSQTSLLSGSVVTARQIAADHPLVTNHYAASNVTVVSLRLPASLGGPWNTGIVYIFGCKEGASQPSFVSIVSAPFSGRHYCVPMSIALVVLSYLLIALAVYSVDIKESGNRGKVSVFFRYLNPVILTAGSNGKGSLSKLTDPRHSRGLIG